MKTVENKYICEFVHDFVGIVTYHIRRCITHLSDEVLQDERLRKIDVQKSFDDVIDVIAFIDRALNSADLWGLNQNINSLKTLAQYAEKLNEISRVFGSRQEDYKHHLRHFMSRCHSAGIAVA